MDCRARRLMEGLYKIMNPEEDTKLEVMEQLPAPSNEYIAQAEARSLEFMNPKRWQVMNVMAQTFIQSGALPSSIKNAAQLIMVWQRGYEAGMQPMEALDAFYFVNGKLSIYGDMAIAQVIKAGHEVDFANSNDKTATCTITRGDTKKSLTGTFTMAMANERGLTAGKDPWKKSPENMLKFKAFHSIAKFIVPEALRGIQIKEIAETEIEVDSPMTSHADPKVAAVKAAKKPSLAEALEDKPEVEVVPQAPETTQTEESETAPEALTAIEARKFIEDNYVAMGLSIRGTQWMLKKAIGKPMAKIHQLSDSEAIKVAAVIRQLLEGNEELPDEYLAGVERNAA